MFNFLRPRNCLPYKYITTIYCIHVGCTSISNCGSRLQLIGQCFCISYCNELYKVTVQFIGLYFFVQTVNVLQSYIQFKQRFARFPMESEECLTHEFMISAKYGPLKSTFKLHFQIRTLPDIKLIFGASVVVIILRTVKSSLNLYTEQNRKFRLILFSHICSANTYPRNILFISN